MVHYVSGVINSAYSELLGNNMQISMLNAHKAA